MPSNAPHGRRSDPAADLAAWTDIEFANHHTAEELAWVEAAIRNADDTAAETAAGHTDAVAGPVTRRDATWCRIALHSYEFLRVTGAYAHLGAAHAPAGPPTWCSAEPDVVRAWLTAPSTQDRGRTVAASLGIDDQFAVNDPDLADHLAQLVTAARDVGVFGAAGHRIDLWQLADVDNFVDGHLLTVETPLGVRLASRYLPPDALFEADNTGVDAAVDVLRNAESAVDEMLDRYHGPPPGSPIQTTPAATLARAAFATATNPEPAPPPSPGAAQPGNRGGMRRRSI